MMPECSLLRKRKDYPPSAISAEIRLKYKDGSVPRSFAQWRISLEHKNSSHLGFTVSVSSIVRRDPTHIAA